MCSKAARAIAAHSASVALGCCSDVVPVSTDCPTACFTNVDMVRHIVGDHRVSRDGLGAHEDGTPIREAMIPPGDVGLRRFIPESTHRARCRA
jgi:hypothetical protein